MELEICVDSYESLINAKKAGADRIELCSALEIGGLTPSYGLMKEASELEDIEIFVMIRSRSGDFYYEEMEIETMKKEIDLAKELKLEGIVFAALNVDGSLNLKLIKEMIDYAKPLKLALHRAFDVAKDPEKDMEALIDMGVIRILTSGREDRAIKGADFISKIQKEYGDRIQIMPGSGVNSSNLQDLHKLVNCKAYHMSGKKRLESKLQYRSKIKFSDDDYARNITDPIEVKKARDILDKLEGVDE
ncbi:MAG: copper homeostasis protein CutC [Tissierellia bacterium]|nr:copper homeostasis protein CutC [Tissierellia bacterium]